MNGLYQVSNFGRVKRLKITYKTVQSHRVFNSTRIEKIITNRLSKGDRYYRVSLIKDSKEKRFLVHRLVAEAFLPNPKNYTQINHKDENKLNNNISNLEWCNAEYNSNYGTRNSRNSKSHINHPDFSKSVMCVETKIIYPSIAEAHRVTGANQINIGKVCRGERNTAGGFHWIYCEQA